ncbi:unnamed protein product [Owenia fusiformis]|uniref:Uncharacterized protein n=1 Tax=Owenia fusiformis TaxID=6347 RepID=A0A8J1UXE2_OWEFU|nr:unnamed protein product [Owenia fusiformis]
MAPIHTSMFDESGNLKTPTNKYVLNTKTGRKNINEVYDDTSVLILLLHYYEKHHLIAYVTMESVSTSNKNVTSQLLAARSLKDCDTTSSLYHIGKTKAVNTRLEMLL